MASRGPEEPSSLSEVLGARCALAVREAEDKEPIARATIYLAPPMPDAALRLAQPDYVLPLPEIAALLVRLDSRRTVRMGVE